MTLIFLPVLSPRFSASDSPKQKTPNSKRSTHIKRASLCENQVSGPQTLTKQKHKAGVEGGGVGRQGQERNNHKGSGTSKSPQRLSRPQTTFGKPPAYTGLGNFRWSLRQPSQRKQIPNLPSPPQRC